MTARLVLASASPRRRELLATAGLKVEVIPSDAAESPTEGEEPEAMVRRLAAAKASVVSAAHPEAFVLGADTTVVVDGEMLAKPAHPREAALMLRRLSGRWHEVVTGVALVRAGEILDALAEVTRVHVRELDDVRIARYLATGEHRDKAGAYGIQGVASGFVDRVEGSYTSVVGLPVAETLAMLEAHGAIGAWP
ncbi:MAG: Maf family protein [Sandaracinaceae bacterium]